MTKPKSNEDGEDIPKLVDELAAHNKRCKIRSFKYVSISVDGSYETLSCSTCMSAIIVPAGRPSVGGYDKSAITVQ